MIKIENVITYGWDAAIRGMRNPMNSWNKSDSYFERDIDISSNVFSIGQNDLALMKRLIEAGPDHAKFMRMIGVSLDIIAPLYWWKEFDTYKIGTIANSCSTMHKIHAKEFTLDDFSHEHLVNMFEKSLPYSSNEMFCINGIGYLEEIIEVLNGFRSNYLKTKDKLYWWQMIQLLPTSYNQRRTVTLNYAVLANMYHARKEHKLDEWREFCKCIKGLPYSELITG